MILDDLRAWVIAYTGPAGQGFVGKVSEVSRWNQAEGAITLDAPYVLASGYIIAGTVQQKQLARPYILFPLELLVTPTSLRVNYTALLRLEDLDAADFKHVARSLMMSIDEAEAMRAGIRAQRSGVVLAPTGLKV